MPCARPSRGISCAYDTEICTSTKLATGAGGAHRRARDRDGVRIRVVADRDVCRGCTSPGSLALGRLLVSLVALGVAARIWRVPLPQAPRPPRRSRPSESLWLGVYSVSRNAAERRVDAGTAAMLINTGPILIAVLAGLLLGEGFPRRVVRRLRGGVLGLRADRPRELAGGAAGRTRHRAPGPRGLRLRRGGRHPEAGADACASPLQVTWLGCASRTAACAAVAPALAADLGGAGAGRDRLEGSISASRRRRSASRPGTYALRSLDRGPAGDAHLPDPFGGDPARLGAARRDAAAARGGRRRALPRRGRPRPAPPALTRASASRAACGSSRRACS